MKTTIVYYSQHHGNTKKLLDAICDADISVELINAAEKIEVDLREYDRIGFASGIYFSTFAKPIISPNVRVFISASSLSSLLHCFTQRGKSITSFLGIDLHRCSR